MTADELEHERPAEVEANASNRLIPLKTEELRRARPDWPWSGWATWKMVRQGRLGFVRVGRRLFVTPELMAEFVAKHTRAEGEYKPEPRNYRARASKAR